MPLDLANEVWCKNCGHMGRIHTPECQGIVGSHNDPDGDTEQPCDCKELVPRGGD
jgi:hypothetical protein